MSEIEVQDGDVLLKVPTSHHDMKQKQKGHNEAYDNELKNKHDEYRKAHCKDNKKEMNLIANNVYETFIQTGRFLEMQGNNETNTVTSEVLNLERALRYIHQALRPRKGGSFGIAEDGKQYIDDVITEKDRPCGRGGCRLPHRRGNKLFPTIVEKYHERYQHIPPNGKQNRERKENIAESVIKEFEEQGGRFLARGACGWCTIDEENKIKITNNALCKYASRAKGQGRFAATTTPSEVVNQPFASADATSDPEGFGVDIPKGTRRPNEDTIQLNKNSLSVSPLKEEAASVNQAAAANLSQALTDIAPSTATTVNPHIMPSPTGVPDDADNTSIGSLIVQDLIFSPRDTDFEELGFPTEINRYKSPPQSPYYTPDNSFPDIDPRGVVTSSPGTADNTEEDRLPQHDDELL